MACPKCGNVNLQKWYRGYSQTLETPEEFPGWECGACGHEYSKDEEQDDSYDEREEWGEEENE